MALILTGTLEIPKTASGFQRALVDAVAAGNFQVLYLKAELGAVPEWRDCVADGGEVFITSRQGAPMIRVYDPKAEPDKKAPQGEVGGVRCFRVDRIQCVRFTAAEFTAPSAEVL